MLPKLWKQTEKKWLLVAGLVLSLFLSFKFISPPLSFAQTIDNCQKGCMVKLSPNLPPGIWMSTQGMHYQPSLVHPPSS